MKTTYIYLSILAATALGLGSCEKYLDEVESKQQIQAQNVKTVQELDILMTGAYSGIAREVAFGGNALVIGETFADLVSINNAGYRNAPGRSSRVYTWTHREEDYGYQAEFLQWSTFGLNNANNVLEILRTNQVQTPAETDPRKDINLQKGRIEGDARFVRALCIFEQTRLLGYPWGHTPDNSHPGPVGNYSSISDFGDLSYPRLSVRAAYDSVLNDLRLAERLLPESYNPAQHLPDMQPRANKYAALALMARVYWQQDNVDSCLAVCNRLLGQGNQNRFPLVAGNQMLANVFQRTGIMPTTNSDNRSEVIFELVNVAGRNARTTNGAPLRTHYTLQSVYTAAQLANVNNLTSGPNLRLSQRFKNLANFDRTRDLRYRTLIDTTQAATAATAWNSPNRLWFARKWGVLGTANLGPTNGVNSNIVMYRSAEFLLIRAEMNQRKGNIAQALTDLNAVRTRAGTAALATAPANLLDEIRTEFVRETFGEGTRIHSLRRIKSPINTGDRSLSPSGVDCVMSGCNEVPWNSRLLVFVVPQTMLDRNPLMVQND
ncbi:MAG: RagB/SusD family nutrient uptake outer membrane protein [Runella slithyformis]|nr:MAG: RagB/SusD family nutrient uptake outer membrane protein [Runella slithyformis]TAF23725.1 MAG: RagB/SusD family nutrient uptake outer membrane protein [Runella slithyformis]TAF49269.1 MAG: RagB/SusD family nutrient uptake outer membrane protein [Runella slithyformis]TAF78929.1 MAG: RagB/SusD family nutrient uptake outer membrane protein [Runella slithyformis]